MASGVEHERAYNRAINWLQPVTLAVAANAIYIDSPMLLCSAAGFLLGLYVGRRVDPDLDMTQITLTERRAIQRNFVFGHLWRIYWLPYSKLIPHRSPLSHLPGAGTLLRWLYLFWLLFLAQGLILLELNSAAITALFVAFWIGEFAGQCWMDLVHLWMDDLRIFWPD